MIEKSFAINADRHSVRCQIYRDDPREVRDAVIYGHGFGGHKDTRAAARFASRLLSKNKAAAVIAFDWPCHGEDARKTLTLPECDAYLTLVIAHAKEQLRAERLYGYATSFGGYLFLKYISEHGSPFVKTVLRCPAVNMYKALTQTIMTPGDLEKIGKSKPVEAGFDRKVRIDAAFLEELKKSDVTQREFIDWAEDILILHGEKDEIIPCEESRAFADDNLIGFLPVPGADHRFTDPEIMDLAINRMIRFMGLK